MGFKMNGSPAKLGTIQGTAGHRSALKIKSIEARKQEIAAAGQASASGEASASPTKQKAYGGTKTWGEGQASMGGKKGDPKTGLNRVTLEQRAYEKKMKAKDPKWNKREDNTWKKRQNIINKALGSKKVYDVISDKKTVTQTDSRGTQEVMKGIQRKGEKTLTEKEKQEEKTKIAIEKEKIKDAKKDKDKDKRDVSQAEIGRIRGGGDDKYTGTVVSRTLGKLKEKRNIKQLERREKKRTKLEERYKKRAAKGKSTKRIEKKYTKKGGDVEELEKDSPTKNMKTGKYKQKFEKK